jgi:putative cell wall-binding protein
MKLGIMQPYFFPYLGYFQLINAVDKFIFYDDVNFIKNGWINRNRILINGNPVYLTVQLNEASSFKLINEIEFSDNTTKLIKSIELAYRQAPYFIDTWPVLKSVFETETDKISQLAISSIIRVCEFLNIKTRFEVSSNNYSDTKGMVRSSRILELCKRNYAHTYINPIGGESLYRKDEFSKEGIDLLFLKTGEVTYSQKSIQFVSGLSIIDVLMFNSKPEISRILGKYKLI